MKGATLRGSLRFRLLAGTLFWILASILVAGWGLGNLFRDHVSKQFHAELRTHLDQLTARVAVDGQGLPTLTVPLGDPRLDKPFAGLYWQVDRIASEGLPAVPGAARSRSLWDQVLEVPPDAPADGEMHVHRIAGPQATMLGAVERTVRIEGVPLRLVVAADERLMEEPIARFKGALWLALGVLGAGLAAGALMQVMFGLAPLRKLRRALARVRDGDAQRMEGEFPAEILPVVDELNTVLAQNEQVVARARTHAGNLAHALKTPLTVLANAARDRNDALAQLVTAQVDRARTQVDRHLARAQAAGALQTPGARAAILPVIEGLVRTMQRVHAQRDLELVARPVEATATFRGEEQDLQEMLGNLLDNACKWAKRRIEVGADLRDDRLVIEVDDDGPGIAAAQRDAVSPRGARADEMVEGTGLGLAIVDDLARIYGGSLALSDSPLGGLRATLTLPAARPGVGT